MFKTKMKIKFLLLLFCIVTVSAINAQNLAVKGFRLLENDLTANTHGTSKSDQNGETAALIKIVTPESGFNFDGGSLGIVESQQKVGEIWVYVPARAQKITISHKQFGVLRDYYYKLAIEAGRTMNCYWIWEWDDFLPLRVVFLILQSMWMMTVAVYPLYIIDI